MTVAISTDPARDKDEGDWPSLFEECELDDYEKIAVKTFIEILEACIEPSMHLDYKENDIIVTFLLGTWGAPAWKFSFKDALNAVSDCNEEDVLEFIKILRKMSDFAEMINKNRRT